MENAAALQQAPVLNLLDPEFRKNPFPFLAYLREHDPVHRVKWGAWVITRHADVMAVLRHKSMSRDMRNWSAYSQKATWKQHQEIERLSSLYMMNTDAPDHPRLRSLMAYAFTPNSVSAMRPLVSKIADELLDDIQEGESFDFMEKFALPLPLKVICGLFDFPYEDYPHLRRWSEAFAPFVEMSVTREQKDAMGIAGMEFFAYLRNFIAVRRENPGTGLVDRLISARIDGQKLSEDELLMNIAGMLFAGHETTTNQIGNGLLALLRNPEQLQKLRDNPELMPNAAKEFLRYDGSSNIVIRVATEDLVLHGKTIKPGDVIMCMLGSANRDPEAFENPDQLDISREDNPHTTYGGGRHHCIGAQLANMEIEVAFERLLARYSRIEVDESRLTWLDRVNLRGLHHFPVTVQR